MSTKGAEHYRIAGYYPLPPASQVPFPGAKRNTRSVNEGCGTLPDRGILPLPPASQVPFPGAKRNTRSVNGGCGTLSDRGILPLPPASQVPFPLKGEGSGMGSSFRKLSPDLLQNKGSLLHDLFIRESNYCAAQLNQDIFTKRIIIGLSQVNTSINLNDQLRFRAIKISNKSMNDMLPAKSETIYLLFPQRFPQQSLGFCWILPHLSGRFNQSFFSLSGNLFASIHSSPPLSSLTCLLLLSYSLNEGCSERYHPTSEERKIPTSPPRPAGTGTLRSPPTRALRRAAIPGAPYPPSGAQARRARSIQTLVRMKTP